MRRNKNRLIILDSIELRLDELGERKLITNIFSSLNMAQEKDDCAVLDYGDEYLLLSTDIIRETTHIPAAANPSLIGKYVANINLSDIAAMAGIPMGMLVSYLIEPETDEDYFRKIVSAIDTALKAHDCSIIGGDTKEGAELVISGSILGHQTKKLTRRRSYLKKGDIVGVTNTLGRSAAGYVFYKTNYRPGLGVEMMLDINARVREAQIMSEHGARFMMDLSDGLYSSIYQMKQDYGIGFKIVEDEIKPARNAKKASEISGIPLTDLICASGGDYELFFSIANSEYKDFQSAMESEKIIANFIGEAWEGENMMFDGKRWNKLQNRGYEHFAEKPFSI